MSIEFLPVSKNDKDYPKIVDLYKKTFPKKERFPLWLLFYEVKSQNAHFSSLYENDDWIGFLYTIEYGNIVMVLYFAISERFRLDGYDAKVFTMIKEKHLGKRVVLDIEEIPERRRKITNRG